jgi:D-glycero-beta-D-manno-heptose-7-phosphate kinase
MTLQDIDALFGHMSDVHVAVIGDVMLDSYWWGEVERISPEAPVPVVQLQRKEDRLGGAANVALNCRSLGATVTLIGVVGTDENGRVLTQMAADAGMQTLLYASAMRPTTTKTRIISRNQQMMRLDYETTDDLYTEEEHPFIKETLEFIQIQKPQVVIFQDYNKGVLKRNVIDRIMAHCQLANIITAVDPKLRNFLAYVGATIFKPNLKEVREGMHLRLDTVSGQELSQVHDQLAEALHHQVTFITLSEKGVFYHDRAQAAIVPSHIRNIADVSGAGDTVIATAALVYALTRDARLMAEISNIAGGLVCEQVGVVPVDKEQLRKECERLLAD